MGKLCWSRRTSSSDMPGMPVVSSTTLNLSGVLETTGMRSEEHTSELQSRQYLVCRLLLEKKNKIQRQGSIYEWSSSIPLSVTSFRTPRVSSTEPAFERPKRQSRNPTARTARMRLLTIDGR